MKIIAAPDSFKGLMSAAQVCRIIADEIRKYDPRIEVIAKPMADGGEGTADALLATGKGKWITKEVTGPLPDMKVKAAFAWFEKDKEAVVEMAKASGIELLSKEQLNPLKTTTYGTGQLIKAAMEYGAEKIYLAVGGSATVDGGTGAAAALGWKFLDDDGNPVNPGGENLGAITEIIEPEDFDIPQVIVLSDVSNPLCGPNGAARVFAPQKGATPEMVTILENNLSNLASLIKAQLHKDIANFPGAGAAGGLAAGAVAFMDAQIVSGVEHIIKKSRLAEYAAQADWIITGEGCFDKQSLMGKVTTGITKVAKTANAKVAVIAGQINIHKDQYNNAGIHTAISCKEKDMSIDFAMENSKELLQGAVRKFIDSYLATV